WNLICKRAHLRAMTQAVYNAGLLVGSVGFGIFSDHYGRRITTFLSLFLMIVFGLGSTFANSLTLFAVMRFGSGLCTAAGLLVKFVYCMEICPLSYRTAMGALCNLFVVIGALILTLIAYLIRDWRYLMLAITLPGIPPLIFWRWVPESPRWLIAKGKLKEAQMVLESFAAASGVKVDSNQLASVIRDVKNAEADARSADGKSKAGVLDLVRTPKMRKRTLVLSYNWFVNSIVFYGITLNAKNLGGSFHLNVFILYVVAIPSVLSLWVVIQRCGRRIGYCVYMLLGGLACLLALTVPSGTPGVVHPAIKGIAVFGVFCITATFSAVYIYNSELSPTLLRHLSLGVGSMMARFGGIIAPYIVFLNDYMQNLPLVVFGIVGVTAGLTALLLPETLFSPMPQTVDQVESWTEDYGVPCRRKTRGPEKYIVKDDAFQECQEQKDQQETLADTKEDIEMPEKTV
ncbi:hypothetical protein QZH41_016938, partial [Actinostola sp. cb2023]